MKEQYGVLDITHLQQLIPQERDAILINMLHQGAGVRQLNRLTGVGKKYHKSLKREICRTMTCPQEDEEWLTYVQEDEYAKYQEY